MLHEAVVGHAAFQQVVSHEAVDRVAFVVQRSRSVGIGISCGRTLRNDALNLGPVGDFAARFVILRSRYAPLRSIYVVRLGKSRIAQIARLQHGNREVASRSRLCFVQFTRLVLLIAIIRQTHVPSRHFEQTAKDAHIAGLLDHVAHGVRRRSYHVVNHVNVAVAHLNVHLRDAGLAVNQIISLIGRFFSFGRHLLAGQDAIRHVGNGKRTVRGKVGALVSRQFPVVDQAVLGDILSLFVRKRCHVRRTGQPLDISPHSVVCRNKARVVTTRLQRIGNRRCGVVGTFGHIHRFYPIKDGHDVAETFLVCQIIVRCRLIGNGKVRRIYRLLASRHAQWHHSNDGKT